MMVVIINIIFHRLLLSWDSASPVRQLLPDYDAVFYGAELKLKASAMVADPFILPISAINIAPSSASRRRDWISMGLVERVQYSNKSLHCIPFNIALM